MAAALPAGMSVQETARHLAQAHEQHSQTVKRERDKAAEEKRQEKAEQDRVRAEKRGRRLALRRDAELQRAERREEERRAQRQQWNRTTGNDVKRQQLAADRELRMTQHAAWQHHAVTNRRERKKELALQIAESNRRSREAAEAHQEAVMERDIALTIERQQKLKAKEHAKQTAMARAGVRLDGSVKRWVERSMSGDANCDKEFLFFLGSDFGLRAIFLGKSDCKNLLWSSPSAHEF